MAGINIRLGGKLSLYPAQIAKQQPCSQDRR